MHTTYHIFGHCRTTLLDLSIHGIINDITCIDVSVDFQAHFQSLIYASFFTVRCQKKLPNSWLTPRPDLTFIWSAGRVATSRNKNLSYTLNLNHITTETIFASKKCKLACNSIMHVQNHT